MSIYLHTRIYYVLYHYSPLTGACGAHGGGEKCAQGSSGETRGKEANWETQEQMGGQY